MSGRTECLPGSWNAFHQYFDKATRDTCLDLGGMAKRLLRREKL